MIHMKHLAQKMLIIINSCSYHGFLFRSVMLHLVYLASELCALKKHLLLYFVLSHRPRCGKTEDFRGLCGFLLFFVEMGLEKEVNERRIKVIICHFKGENVSLGSEWTFCGSLFMESWLMEGQLPYLRLQS